jgi:hypothetical protein
MGLAPWIRIRIRIEIRGWIRIHIWIRIETNHCGFETLLSRTISFRLVIYSYVKGGHSLWNEGDECAGGGGG